MLAAHSLGLGSCWIHRAKEVFKDPEGQTILQQCGILGDYEGIGNLVLGYADYLRKTIKLMSKIFDKTQDGPYFLDQTIKAAESVHIPVVLVGGVRGKEEIEKILSETPISYVAMARPFIADAEYMKGWREEA